MNYKISFSKEDAYVKIRVFETITGNLERELAEKAINNAKQNKVNRFLVDVRDAQNIASSAEQYFFGYKDVNQFGLKIGSKIAILTSKNDDSHDFVETVLINAGYRCQLFQDEDAAVKWLKE